MQQKYQKDVIWLYAVVEFCKVYNFGQLDDAADLLANTLMTLQKKIVTYVSEANS